MKENLKKFSLKDYETFYMPSIIIMVLKSMKELLKT